MPERKAIALSVMLAVSLVFCGTYWFKYAYRDVQSKLAHEQIEMFYRTKKSGLESTTAKQTAQSIRFVRDYYPSGSKQTTGSRLDASVELVRAEVMRDIVDHLQKISGQTLGDDPDVWIRFYAD